LGDRKACKKLAPIITSGSLLGYAVAQPGINPKKHAHNRFYEPFPGPFQDHPGEPVPEEIFFWTLWCKGR